MAAKSSSSAAKWLTIHPYTNTDVCMDEPKMRYEKIFTTHLSDDAIELC